VCSRDTDFGIDERPVGAAGEQKSVSREHTFERDETDRGRVRAVLLGLCDDVARRCRQNGLKGTTVVLIYRSVDFTKHTIRTTLPLDTDVSQELYRHACTLLERVPATAGKFRLIGVGLTGFDGAGQTDLFESAGVHSPWKASDRAMDKIRERFGDKAIRRAGEGTAGNGKAP